MRKGRAAAFAPKVESAEDDSILLSRNFSVIISLYASRNVEHPFLYH